MKDCLTQNAYICTRRKSVNLKENLKMPKKLLLLCWYRRIKRLIINVYVEVCSSNGTFRAGTTGPCNIHHHGHKQVSDNGCAKWNNGHFAWHTCNQ